MRMIWLNTSACFILTLGLPARPLARPLPLKEAFELALRNNESFRINAETLYQVKLLRDKAYALMLPTIRLEGNFTLFDRELSIPLAPGQRIVFQRKNAFGGVGVINMTLFDARAYAGLAQARLTAQATRSSTEYSTAELLFEVSRSYLAVLAAQRLIDIRESTLKLAREHLRFAQARRRGGELLPIAVTRAEIEVLRARRALTDAEKAYQSSTTALAFMVGARGPFTLTRPRVPAVSGEPLPQLEARALSSRRDVLAASQQVEAARRSVDVTKGGYYPTVSLQAISRASQNTALTGNVLNSMTVLTLGWNLFDGGMRYAEIKEKHSKLRQAILRRSLLSRNVRRQVRSALIELQRVESSLRTSRRELELAGRNRRQIMKRYKAGLATTVEVVDAGNALVTAKVAVLAEELRSDTSRIHLLQALGSDPLAVLGYATPSGGSDGEGVR